MASTLTDLLYHLVFSTKERRGLLDLALRDRLCPYMAGIVHGEGGAALAIGGTANHVHMLCQFPASVSVAEMMRRIKGNSSRWVGGGRAFGWQRGYGAFSVSRSQAEDVALYIRRQEEHHRENTFEDELRRLLREHHVDYDERHLWD